MILVHTFSEPEVNLALELFLRDVHGVLNERLVSVILYGSIVFEDLAPGYGDLDFLAVVDGQLSDDDHARLLDIRGPLRSGDYGVICQMIEGAFLPESMLGPDCHGNGLWWGTSSERHWDTNELGNFVIHTIREHGLVVYGKDLRHTVPKIEMNQTLR